jgi:hypothetical protein
MAKKPALIGFLIILALIFSTACGIIASDNSGLIQSITPQTTPTRVTSDGFTPYPSKIPSLVIITATLAPSPSPIPSEIPGGCLKPVDDYTLVNINGFLLNKRTYDMLLHAKELYGGQLDITANAITQGSYTDSEAASFGTHSGGGAVDFSVMYSGTYTVAYEEITPLIQALRTAGFAAWMRDFDELYPGSPIHIHAIAIGDRQLSPAAFEQLTGSYGYFLGYSGVPQENGIPKNDVHGGPVICQWMVDAGYPSPPGTSQDIK